MKFTTVIYGCQMNISDESRIKAMMRYLGFEYVRSIDEAEIVIIITCSVRQKSEDKVTGLLKNIPKDKKVRITGCMVQHNLKFAQIYSFLEKKKIVGLMKRGNFLGVVENNSPEVVGLSPKDFQDLKKFEGKSVKDFVFVNYAFTPLFNILQKKHSNLQLMRRIDDTGLLPVILKKLRYSVKKTKIFNEYEKIIPDYNLDVASKITAYIPISTGCNQFCSYCIVPFARGLERFFDIESVELEVQNALNKGAKEIYLLGQIVNKHPKFVNILKNTLRHKEIKWLRYISPYPTYYNDEIFRLHEEFENLAPHIHIPVQSGSDNVLKKMFRGYTVDEFKKFIEKIRGLKREISITTDIIVGFPGESDEDFKKTLELVEFSRFDMIYIGIYSPRPGTYAATHYKDIELPYSVKQARREELNKLLYKISAENNRHEEGKIKDVLMTKKNGNIYEGYTDNLKNVMIEFEGDLQLDNFYKVEIISGEPLKLKGKLIL